MFGGIGLTYSGGMTWMHGDGMLRELAILPCEQRFLQCVQLCGENLVHIRTEGFERLFSLDEGRRSAATCSVSRDAALSAARRTTLTALSSPSRARTRGQSG